MKMCEVWKYRRIALKMTQQQVAEQAGVTLETVKTFESGRFIDNGDLSNIKIAIRQATESQTKLEHYRMRMLELALELGVENNPTEAAHLIAHLMVEAGKMQMYLLEDK